jgi:hypothetical protein
MGVKRSSADSSPPLQAWSKRVTSAGGRVRNSTTRFYRSHEFLQWLDRAGCEPSWLYRPEATSPSFELFVRSQKIASTEVLPLANLPRDPELIPPAGSRSRNRRRRPSPAPCGFAVPGSWCGCGGRENLDASRAPEVAIHVHLVEEPDSSARPIGLIYRKKFNCESTPIADGDVFGNIGPRADGQ